MVSPMSFVEADPPKSLVRIPYPPCSSKSRTFLTAFSMAFAGFSKRREYRRSIAALRIVPIGLAIPFPAMSGAEPWMGSYRPGVVLKSTVSAAEGAPASDADGSKPSDPGMILD